MDWKIRSPRQFAPLGNLSVLGVQIVSGGVFSNTSLLSAVYYYILHSQSAIASDGPREKLGSQLVSSEKLCQTPSCFISDFVSWLICAEQSCRHGQSPIGLDVDRFSWNSGGATLPVGVVWGVFGSVAIQVAAFHRIGWFQLYGGNLLLKVDSRHNS